MSTQEKNIKIISLTGWFTIALSLIVSVGWILDIAVFKTILPGYVSMKLNTAIFFLLTGCLILVLHKNKKFFGTIILALLLMVFAMVSLSQDIFGLYLGIDELLIQDIDALNGGESFPGRPSPTTSFSFFLFGFVFLTFHSSHNKIRKVSQYSLHIISLIAFIAILGYLFNVPSFYKMSIFTSMAIHTSVTLLVCSVIFSMTQPTMGLTRLFLGNQTGNQIAGTLFIKILGAVLVLGYLELSIVRRNLISVEFGIAIFSTCFVILSLYFLRSAMEVLNKIDNKRSTAENALVLTNKNLESTVRQRTQYLTKQNKQLEDFAHIVSHNLRGPVSNLKTLLSFYKVEDDVAEKNGILDKLDITATNIESTLNELLEVVSIRDASKKKKKVVVFEEVLTKIIGTFQGKIMETNAKVTYNFKAAESLEYSSVYMESILQNLLCNAIKYRSLERNPEIHFKTALIENRAFLTVSDNGLGIDMKRNKRRLFGLHKTFHKHPEAKGVGLFITKAQVEAMGGEISAESELDKGTSFKIKF